MSPPRHPRPSTPLPTIPPPLPDEPSAVMRVAKGIEPWKAIVAVLITAFGAGGTAYAWAHGKADVAQVEQVRDGAAAALVGAQASTGAQLGTLQASVQDLRARQAGVDASLAALTSDVARLNRSADSLYLQLVEIARATGARRVPAPEPDPLTRPP
jgi:hypothetical protein